MTLNIFKNYIFLVGRYDFITILSIALFSNHRQFWRVLENMEKLTALRKLNLAYSTLNLNPEVKEKLKMQLLNAEIKF